MKIKICFVMKYMLVGGVEKSLINLCKILDPDIYVIKLIENHDLKQTVEKNTEVISQKIKNTKEEYYKLFSV